MDRQQKIEALAAEMGVTPADVAGFVAGLSIWINKGLTFEQAIERHMAQMLRFAEHSHEIPRSVVVDAFFPA